MPWHCPACHTIIQHRQDEEFPRVAETYRCHVCRLELMWDAQRRKLEIKPFDHEHTPDRQKPR